jgi:DNA repair protein RadD
VGAAVIQLRPDQDEFVGNLRVAIRSHQAVLGQAPCGFGKTVVAAFMARRVMEMQRRVIFAVHRRDLITQTAKTFAKFGIRFGVMAAGHPLDLGMPVYIASISTLQNRLGRLPANLLVVDECHLSAAEGWSRVVDHYKQTGAHIIGLTATPMRLDGQGLDRHFSAMVKGPSVRWLMEQGHLSGYRLFAPSSPDLKGVGTRMGDYSTGDLAAAMDKSSITGDIVSHYKKLAMGKRTMAFAVNIEHSIHIAEQFKAAGIMAAHIDGSCSPEDRKLAIQAFADGKIQVLSNCSLCCEGFDLSAQVDRDVPVEAVIMARPTQSRALYIQQVGRGIRKKPYPGIILDHAGNVARHGLPDADHDWTLAGREGKGDKKESAVPVRTCEKCFAALPAATDRCPHCGFVFTAKPREIEHRDGELQEVDVERERMQARIQAKREQAKANGLEELTALGAARGYRNPEKWARAILHARQQKAAMRYAEQTVLA